MGVAPTFLMACRKAGLQLGRDFDLRSIRALGFAGSPLPSEGYHYVYEQLGPDVLALNGSGGTDICGAFVSGSFMLPVYDGEISGCCLGADVKAFDADGNVVVGELGEMVDHRADALDARAPVERPRRRALPLLVLRPLPGRLAPGRLDPLHRARELRHHRALRRDAQPRRRAHRAPASSTPSSRSSRRWPTAWSCTARTTRAAPASSSSSSRWPASASSTTSCARGSRARCAQSSRRATSPTPIVAVPAVPRTMTGKKLEAPVKRILLGARADDVASADALLDPTAIEAFVAYAAARA